MNKDTLFQLFTASYRRQSFIDNCLLPTFQGKVQKLIIYDAGVIQPVTLTSSEQEYALSAVKYGEFLTSDEIPRVVELYEVIVKNNKQIERSRIGLGALLKKHIIGNNAILVNFAYENSENRSWRFSFIALDGVFKDGVMQILDTHPKRYTYVFGEPEETYKTALDRFFTLANELDITINKIKDAFGVEAMSKAFFDDYRDVHYSGFVDYLMRSKFKKVAFDGDEKEIRNFVKKLLGRIVFLYFLQKKGWLGAKDTSYKNGDKNFMTNFFRKIGVSDDFYSSWLSKLFFDALNNEFRDNDDFIMPDGEVVKIPYLNGGLFEKESERYDVLNFPSNLFENLFEFFDQYNFTIFEDSAEEHTVAVDPEMLGHIFENLLEDNKDKGAFYTPKEIVHYMTQESLVEYLHTQIPKIDRIDLDLFVKNKANRLSSDCKIQIEHKLDTVKICDPAIGSGAFPMGLLQEIFGIKERIAFELGYENWNPAAVKENIIQNSIYGVDIESGAVDIARLRFWLSLLVDEDMPKALPNLDYKIVVGNSLVSKFDNSVIEIDWQRKFSVGNADKHVKSVQNTLTTISEKQKQFFENKSNYQKSKIKAEIRELKLDVLINQLSFNKVSYLNKNQKVNDLGFGLKTGEQKKNNEIDFQVLDFDSALAKLKSLKDDPDLPFHHFDWKLDFPEVLNPFVNDNTGFDIVIANPPYVGVKGHAYIFDEIKKSRFKRFFKGRAELFYFFFHLALEISNDRCVNTFITTNYYPTSSDGNLLRIDLESNSTLLKFIDFGELKVFSTALGQHNALTIFKRDKDLTRNLDTIITHRSGHLKSFDFNKILSGKDESSQYFTVSQDELFEGPLKYLRIKGSSGGNNSSKIIFDVFKNLPLITDFADVRQGLRTGIDKITDSHIKKYDMGYQKGEGVFILNKKETLEKDLIEDILLKKLFKNSDINKYYVNEETQYYVLYIDKLISINDLMKNHQSIYMHLEKYKPLICSIRESNNESISDWHTLDRSREERIFTSEKIVAPQRSKKNTFAYSNGSFFGSADIYYIIPFDKQVNAKYLTALLNSKLYYFWYYNKGKKKGNMLELYQQPLSETPIKVCHNQEIYSVLLDFLILINKTNVNLDINVPNTFIAETLEEVIDALIYELYFPSQFIQKGIEIEKFVMNIFQPIKYLKEEEQIRIIQQSYQTFREKDNFLRNQIKLMKIELRELLLPILSI